MAKHTYEIDINTSGLISGYKNALKQMEQAGVSTDITKGLTTSLKKLENQFKSLEDEGKRGFTNSRDIENYKNRFDKLLNSLRGFEGQMSRVGVDISDIMKKSAAATQKLNDAFKNIGVKNLDQAMNSVLNSTDKMKAASLALKKELDDRVKQVNDLKTAWDNAKTAAAQNVEAAKTTGASSLKKVYTNANGNNAQIFSRSATTARKDDILTQASEAIKATDNITDAWARMTKYIADNGLDKAFTANGMAGLRQNMEQVFTNAANVAQQEAAKVQAAWNDVLDAENYAREIGNENKGKWSVNKNSAEYLQLADAVRGATEAEREHDTVLQHNVKTDQDMADALHQVNAAEDSVSGSIDDANDRFEKQAYAVYDSARAAEEAARKFDQLKMRMLSLLSATSVFNLIKKEVKATYEDVKQLDKSFASIAMVTTNSVEGMWKSYGHYAQMASQLGQSTDSMIEASALFYQQGLKENEALELTANTMKLATLAGNDFSTATQEMTSAIRGFKMEMSEGAHVTDVYSTLAANAAATVDDIAQAMARTASIANSAGMSFENTSAFLTQMIETTQESAENIGTSLKTIIARFTELKKNVAGTADSEFDDLEYNKVDKALKSVGVSLKDVNGQFRNLDEVFLELSEKWSSLDRNTQRYVATIAAGSRQQSRFIAMMDNYDRTAELMDKAANSTGKADQQFAKYADTMEYKLNQISTKWEEFRVKTLNSDFFKGMLDGVSSFLDRLKNIKTNIVRLLPAGALGIWAAKTFISNMFTTVRTMMSSGNALITGIANKASNIIFKVFNKATSKVKINIDFESLQAQVNQAKAMMEPLKQQLGGEGAVNALVKFDVPSANSNTGYRQVLQDYYNEIINLTGSAEQAKKAIEALDGGLTVFNGKVQGTSVSVINGRNELEKLAGQAKKADEAFKEGERGLSNFERVSATTRMAWQGVASAVSMAAASILSGAATFDEAGDMILKSLITTTITIVTQAWIGGFTTGKTFGEAVDAGLASTGVGAIIVGIGAAIALIFKGIQAGIDRYKYTHKSIDKQIEESEARLKQLQDLKATRDNEAKTEREKAKSIEETKKRYEELSAKVIKTTEEQEEYNDLVKEIRDNFPQIVTYYNEVTGELRVQDELWQNIVDNANEVARVTNSKAYATNNAILEEQTRKFNLNQANREKLVEGLELNSIKKVLNDMSYGTWAELGNEGVIKYLEGKGYSMDKILELSGIKSTDINYQAELDTLLSDLKNGNVELEKKVSEFVEAYSAGTEKLAQDFDKATKAERRSALAVTIQNQTGASAAVADFTAGMSLRSEEKIADTVNNWLKDILPSGVTDYSVEGLKSYASKANGGAGDNLRKSWSDLARMQFGQGKYIVNAQEVMSSISIDGKEITSETWEEIRDDEDKWIEVMEQFQDHAEALIREQQTILGMLPENEAEIIEKLYEKSSTLTAKELLDEQERVKGLVTEQDAKDEVDSYITSLLAEMNTKKGEIGDKLGITWTEISSALKESSIKELKDIETLIDSLVDKYGASVTQAYGNIAFQLKDELGLTSKELQTMLSIDWSDVDLTNIQDLKDDIIEVLSETMTSDEAEKTWEAYFNLAKKHDLTKLAIDNQGALDALEDSIDEKLGKYVENFSGISKIIKSQLEDGFIKFSESTELDKALKEIGLKASDYLTYGSDGTITLDSEKLLHAYQDEAGLQEKILETARQETQEKLTQVKEEIALLDGIDAQEGKQFNVYEIDQAITNELRTQLAILEAMNAVTIDDWSKFESGNAIVRKTEDYAEQRKNLVELENSLQEHLDKDLVPGTEYADQLFNKVIATQKELGQIYREQIPDIKSVKDAQEDYTKALENYNKQLEEVAEKQEDLNEKIKEYNDLLNGSENRKSSLDVLYNYTEAIETFNNEMSRAKDILGNSKSKDESYQALQTYFNSAHNLLVEEKAKQKVIEAGLKNYADMIENGSTSYTNSQTGEVKTINFGQYAKYDQRTGKYMVDQRLLNEAKFADKYKDLIESNIETYNKYADELLKSQDSVRKTEKELQDERLNALKKYTSMEKEIADALKEQYQKEVDQLKDKYDSMKDADDEYLDALEDALNKQKELRERERKYEDLAQKEKKLSLMQRDTSGSNELDTRKLEEEIQNDRESLLEDAINEVVDGLKELYKSNQELNESDIELKQALLDNTAFWNSKAQGIAASFTSAEEYMEYMSNLSTEFADMTLAQQQEKLLEYGQSYEEATEYMALVAMDSATETQDYIVEVVETTGEEIGNVIIETSETFTYEVTRMFDEVTAAFMEDMKKAQDAINDANKALDEANQKLVDYQNELAEAGAALAQANSGSNDHIAERPVIDSRDADLIYGAMVKAGFKPENMYELRGLDSEEKITALREYATNDYQGKSGTKLTDDEIKALKDNGFFVGSIGSRGNEIFKISSDEKKIKDWVNKNAPLSYGGHVYKSGGLVDYTGPAWVDGTPDQPEAFLNSEDTKAIGNAAKILSDIPSVRNYEEGTTITNNNGGDVTVEVNINVDHMDSDADIEYIVNRVKDEIVEVARPIGSSVILQQQV